MAQKNISAQKQPMPTQAPSERIHNFHEVALGYSPETAIEEARRCLNCPQKPCQKGCPVGIDIPGFIRHIAAQDFEAAYETLSRATALPAVCGRVCPQETQCERHCIRGIRGEPVAIGHLERFIADWRREHPAVSAQPCEKTGHRIAVIGSGPSGLTAAGLLAQKGHSVTIFEALHQPGGVLVYGIPEFRLPKEIVASEIQALQALGVTIETNMVIGKVLTIDELMEDMAFEAVYIASGAGLPRFMGIPGECLNGVYSANEYLTRINLMKAYLENSATPIRRGRHVAVIGGGNVAMDAARCALRLGAQTVSVVYRRSMEELPARREEVEHAAEEGITFCTCTAPKEILEDGSGSVRGLRCVKTELGEPDSGGRRRPMEVPGSDFILDADTVVVAIGTTPNPLISSTTPGLDTNDHGCIITGTRGGATNRSGIWAGGDAVTGAATVILAMGAGKAAAEAIHACLTAPSHAPS